MACIFRGKDTSRRGLHVVVTGSTKGIGLALVREFLRLGDNVVVCARSAQGVEDTVAALRSDFPSAKVHGCPVDVSDGKSVEALAAFAKQTCGQVDLWINNAGTMQPARTSVADTPEAVLRSVIDCNLIGTLNCDRVAINLMKAQSNGGHIFNMDGAGSSGRATPQYAIYGASKAGFPQLLKSLTQEVEAMNAKEGSKVGVHCLDPGLVITELLMTGNKDPKALGIINILAERPSTVAEFLVPKVRAAAVDGSNGTSIRYLTLADIAYRFLTAPLRKNRLFTLHEDGRVTDNETGSELVAAKKSQ